MKGVVFTEFLEMVESRFSLEVADQIIVASALPSEGAYTAVGTYDHKEFVRLIVQLSQQTGVSVSDLAYAFGKHLFGRFHLKYPQFFEGVTTAFDFLENIERHIHVEVRKLYPDAELPRFDSERPTPSSMTLTYRSNRPFARLAEGLIAGCVEHFGETVNVQAEDLSGGQSTHVRFLLTKKD